MHAHQDMRSTCARPDRRGQAGAVWGDNGRLPVRGHWVELDRHCLRAAHLFSFTDPAAHWHVFPCGPNKESALGKTTASARLENHCATCGAPFS